MIALILNSGRGLRMGELTLKRPKGLVEIGGGYTLLSRQLTQLAGLGVAEAVITTGPFADMLEAHARGLGLPIRLTFVHNPGYAVSNYILSMHLAAPLLHGKEVLLLHGDLVLESSVLHDLLHSPVSAMAADRTLPLPQKDFKAKLRKGNIVAVGVEFFGEDCVACQPAYRWRTSDYGIWMESCNRFVRQGKTTVYAETAFNALDGRLPLIPLELNGRLCHEIDDPEDLATVAPGFWRGDGP